MKSATLLLTLTIAAAAAAQAPGATGATGTTGTTGAKAAAPNAAGTKTAQPNTKQATPNTKATDTKGAAATTGATGATGATGGTSVPVIMREVFTYAPEARRDPFFSLLSSSELRPTISDLRLTGILFDESGRSSIATMRDVSTKEFYRVQTGSLLGRMRVALIKRKVVIFSIEEFGLNRQDSLVLGDTTRARTP